MIDADEPRQLSVPTLLSRSGLSQNKLAEILGIKPHTIGGWKRGVIPTQPPSVYWKIMNICGCTLEELIEALEGPEVLEALKQELRESETHS